MNNEFVRHVTIYSTANVLNHCPSSNIPVCYVRICLITLLANNADPDQTVPSEQSDLGVHWLLIYTAKISRLNMVYSDLSPGDVSCKLSHDH